MQGESNRHDTDAQTSNCDTAYLNAAQNEVDHAGEMGEGSSSSGAQVTESNISVGGASGLNPEAYSGSIQGVGYPDGAQLIGNYLPENTFFRGPSAMSPNFDTQFPPHYLPSPSSHYTTANGVIVPNLLGGYSMGVQFSVPSHVGFQMPAPVGHYYFVRPPQNSFGLGVQLPQHGYSYQPPTPHFFPLPYDHPIPRIPVSSYHPAGPIFGFEASASRNTGLTGCSPALQSSMFGPMVQPMRAISWPPSTFPQYFPPPWTFMPSHQSFQAEEFWAQQGQNLNSGLTEEIILARLLWRKHPATSTQIDLESCRICLDEYREGHELVRLDCGHEFHFECIKRWLKEKNLCPLCKRTGLAE